MKEGGQNRHEIGKKKGKNNDLLSGKTARGPSRRHRKRGVGGEEVPKKNISGSMGRDEKKPMGGTSKRSTRYWKQQQKGGRKTCNRQLKTPAKNQLVKSGFSDRGQESINTIQECSRSAGGQGFRRGKKQRGISSLLRQKTFETSRRVKGNGKKKITRSQKKFQPKFRRGWER